MATASKPAATANDDQISAGRVDGLALCGCELGRRGYEKSAPGRAMRSQAVERSGGSIDASTALPEGSSYLISHCLRLPQRLPRWVHTNARSRTRNEMKGPQARRDGLTKDYALFRIGAFDRQGCEQLPGAAEWF